MKIVEVRAQVTMRPRFRLKPKPPMSDHLHIFAKMMPASLWKVQEKLDHTSASQRVQQLHLRVKEPRTRLQQITITRSVLTTSRLQLKWTARVLLVTRTDSAILKELMLKPITYKLVNRREDSGLAERTSPHTRLKSTCGDIQTSNTSLVEHLVINSTPMLLTTTWLRDSNKREMPIEHKVLRLNFASMVSRMKVIHTALHALVMVSLSLVSLIDQIMVT